MRLPASATLLLPLLMMATTQEAGAQSRQRLDVAGVAFGASIAEASKASGMQKASQIRTKDGRLLNTLFRKGVRLYGEEWHIRYTFGTGDRLTRAFATFAEDSTKFTATECSRRADALLAQMTRAHGAPTMTASPEAWMQKDRREYHFTFADGNSVQLGHVMSEFIGCIVSLRYTSPAGKDDE